MKLNLLPTYVGRGRQIFLASFISLIMVLASVGTSLAMITNSNAQLTKVKSQANDYVKPVQDAIAHAAKAEQVIAPTRDIIRNIELARAMDAHNPVYPKFYDGFFPYIPSFFRITSIQASPIDGANANVTMTGIIKTQQQYIDLMLALLRIPGARTVTRSPFTSATKFVPPLTAQDQVGRTIDPDSPPLPADPLQRLDALLARGGVSPAVNNAGNFGTETTERGPMPDYQLVTVSVQVPGALMTPNPRATLGGGGGGGGRGAGGGGGAGGGRRGRP